MRMYFEREIKGAGCSFFSVLVVLFCLLVSLKGFTIEPLDEKAIGWQSAKPWTEGRFPYEGRAMPVSYSIQTKRALLQGNLKVSAGCFYPQFYEDNEFFQSVNQAVSQNAKTIFCEWISNMSLEEMKTEEFDQEAIDIAFDRREFQYKLTPVYATPKLISIFGETNKFSGLPHGSSRYLSLNFWWDGRQVNQIALGQMINCSEEFEEFVSSYCTKFFKENRIGYFSVADEFSSTIDIQLEDCDIVTLSESGLTITFQPYKVGGWADGPYSVTMPFKDLTNFIISDGPISHFVKSLH